jgi:excisionase family DNA binding protein
MGKPRSDIGLTTFLTTEEVLECLKVTPRTVYRLIKSGDLPAVRIGRQWRFRRADLHDWLDRKRAVVS